MPGPTTVPVPLRWSDMDAYAHVNNVQYLRLLEDARVLGFREWFGPSPSMLDEGVVVTRHEIEYLAPLEYRSAPVVVRMWVTCTSPTGFTIGYQIADSTDPAAIVYAVATTGLALFDFTSLRPRRMSPAERAVLEGLTAPPPTFRWRER